MGNLVRIDTANGFLTMRDGRRPDQEGRQRADSGRTCGERQCLELAPIRSSATPRGSPIF